MRQRRPKPRARVRHIVTRHNAEGNDDPFFEDREPEVDGCETKNTPTPDK